MSFDRRLVDVLKDRNKGLFYRLTEIRKLAETILIYTSAGFPYYTPHSFVHSSNVEENLDWILTASLKLSLNDYEIFFLVVAAWMHDWGMVTNPGESPDEVRAVHHIRTEVNFERFHSMLGLSEQEAAIIGRISRGHRKEDLDGPLFDERVIGANIHINVRFLAAVLRLADECDITANRVPELIYYNLNPGPDAATHFKRHMDIGGVGNDGPQKIIFNAIVRDPKGAEAVRQLKEKMQGELDGIRNILRDHGILYEFVDCRLDVRGFIDKPIGFELDRGNVTNILIGDALYSRRDAAIRELLQNAVETCRWKRAQDKSANVWIRLYREGDKLVVEDSGEGMDYERALNFLATKGISYYRSAEFKELPESANYDPISKWGLGILSCFMICNSLVIETKRKDREPCRFVVGDYNEGWRYEVGSLTKPGTIITLQLNDEGKKIDLEEVVPYYVKSSDVPIFVGKDTRAAVKFDWNFQDNEIQKTLKQLMTRYGWLYRQTDFPVEPTRTHEDDEIWVRLYRTNTFSNILAIAKQGFLVRIETSPSSDFPMPSNGICLVNVKKDIVDLTISRDDIRTNTSKFQNFRNKWIDAMFEFSKAGLVSKKRKRMNPVDLLYHQWRALSTFELDMAHRVLEDESDSIPAAYTRILLDELVVLSIKGKKFVQSSIRKVVRKEPRKLVVYQMITSGRRPGQEDFLQTLREEIGLIESQFASLAKKGEELIVIGTDAYQVEPQQREFRNLIKQVSPTIETKFVGIDEIVFGVGERKDTPLDFALPDSCRFGVLPTPLRGGCSTLKVWTVTLREDIRITPYLLISIVRPFVFRSITGIGEQNAILKLMKKGELIIDLNDKFVAFLMAKSDEIRERPDVAQAVTSYLRLLVRQYLLASEDITDLIGLSERELARVLDSKASFPQPELRWGQAYLAVLNARSTPERDSALDLLRPSNR